MGRNTLNNLAIGDLYSDYCGLVSFIAKTERLLAEPEVHVLAAELCTVQRLNYKNNPGSNGSGAGLTHEEALYSTLGECAERYALSIYDEEMLIFGSYEELHSRYDLVEPDKWNLFSDQQFGKIPFHKFTEKSRIAWAQVDDLLNQKECYVPACAVYLPYIPSPKNESEEILYPAVSTGAACAVTASEAMLKGIYELIERDAFLINWRNMIPMTEIIIDENSAIYETYIRRFKRSNLEYKLYSTTLDFKVCSVFGVLYNKEKDSGKQVINCGGACHHDPEIAVLKTMLELVQGLKWGEYTKSERINPTENFSNIQSFKDRMLMYSTGDFNHAFEFLAQGEKINLSEIQFDHSLTITERLKKVIANIKEKNYGIYALDMTTDDIRQCNLFITKVIIPELETMEGNYQWQFSGKTRHKELPAKLGLRCLAANASNPFPHPYP